MSWFNKNGSVYTWIPESYQNNLVGIKNVICFDLDWTLVKPEFSKFPSNSKDNNFMDHRTKTLLKYIKLGYHIVVFSNQKLTPKEPLKFKLDRMNDIISKFKSFNIDMILLMAVQDDINRKPNIGMWLQLKDGIVDIKAAFYCGDAAGRPGDFSDSDLIFAKNIGVPFYTPEQIFISDQ